MKKVDLIDRHFRRQFLKGNDCVFGMFWCLFCVLASKFTKISEESILARLRIVLNAPSEAEFRDRLKSRFEVHMSFEDKIEALFFVVLYRAFKIQIYRGFVVGSFVLDYLRGCLQWRMLIFSSRK